MNERIEPVIILMAEDDSDDRLLTREAWAESRLINDLYFVEDGVELVLLVLENQPILVINDLYFVEDGVELLDYLHRRGKYADAPRPDLILLDLNMPRMDGREALAEIKTDPNLRCIPVVVLTTSAAEEDIVRSYDLGVSGFITKPVTFDELVEAMRIVGEYWFAIVKLPPK